MGHYLRLYACLPVSPCFRAPVRALYSGPFFARRRRGPDTGGGPVSGVVFRGVFRPPWAVFRRGLFKVSRGVSALFTGCFGGVGAIRRGVAGVAAPGVDRRRRWYPGGIPGAQIGADGNRAGGGDQAQPGSGRVAPSTTREK